MESYVQELLQGGGVEKSRPQTTRSAAKIAAFFRAMAEGSDQLPPLPTESFTRSSYYEDRY